MPSVAVAFAVAVLTLPPLHVDGQYFKDERGAVVVLRGVNVAGDAKVPPFVGVVDEAQLDPLVGWGMNVMRLLFTWEAYEPAPGAYNDAYLDHIAALARAAAERGVYTLVDFHQDALARTLLRGCGEGFPAWAISKRVAQVVADNGAACATWGVRMLLDKPLQAAWHGFYNDEEHARTAFLTMARRVAERLGSMDGVIGYDLLNEPMGDERYEIAPFYADLGAALQQVDPDAILFATPHATTSAGLQSDMPRPALFNVVYAPHFYDSVVMALGVWPGHTFMAPFPKMLAKASEWRAPLFVGEFGAPAGTWGGARYMNMLYRNLDDSFVSGAQWGYTPGWTAGRKDGWNSEDFSIVDDTGAVRATFKPRPYAQRIAGTPVHFSSTQTKQHRVVDLSWVHEPAMGETRVFLPSLMFGAKSYALSTTGEGVQCKVHAQGVVCTSERAGTKSIRME